MEILFMFSDSQPTFYQVEIEIYLGLRFKNRAERGCSSFWSQNFKIYFQVKKICSKDEE